MMTVSGRVLLAAGAVLLVIAAWGVIVLPDALARQHAATKAATLALRWCISHSSRSGCSPRCRWRRTCWHGPR